MSTPFFEYYISVNDKNGLPLGYGKKMSKDTFTMDGVNMISDNDPNYEFRDLELTDKVLDDAGFHKLSTSQYNISAEANDIFYHIPVIGNKVVEVLYRAGAYYYVKPSHPAVQLILVKSISAIQTEAVNECPNIVLPLLDTIINRKKLYSYMVGHIQGRYHIETKRIDANGKITITKDEFSYLALVPIEVNAYPVIELRIINSKCASADIHTVGMVHVQSYNTWDDVVRANSKIKTMQPQQVSQIREAYELVCNSINYSKSC